MVTLHRVGPDTAAPLDSARTGPDGRYAFSYRRTGSADAVYFVSSTYSGIAYFTQPLRTAKATGDDAEITVFDTTSARVPLSLRGRHMIVSAPGTDAMRTIVEVFEVSNDSTITFIATGDRGTWSTILPDGTQRFRVGQGDVPPDAVNVTGGRARVYAPLAPGVKQFSVSYGLPQSSFPLALPLERATSVLEVLVEEPGVTVGAPGLREVAPVTVEGRTFRRFLGQDAPATGILRIDAPEAGLSDQHPLLFAVLVAGLGALMLLALARAFTRTPATVRIGSAVASPAPAAEPLARAIAELDDAFARKRDASPAERAAYTTRRAALKTELTAALAARAG